MARKALLAFLVSLAIAISAVEALSLSQLNNIRLRVKNLIETDATSTVPPNNRRILAGLVRLIFHDCVGDRCDGCVNTKSHHNAGLELYINLIEPLYQQFLREGLSLSRADYWAIASTEAAYYAALLVNPVCANPLTATKDVCTSQIKPSIIFKTGRVDCASSPNTTAEENFPDANIGTQEIIDYFKVTFGFGPKETAAIMGAHTLGAAHRQASGFSGPWDPAQSKLNNEFYAHLLDPRQNWTQHSVSQSNKIQWQSGNTMMLNSDVSLVKDLGIIAPAGNVSCTFSSCPYTTLPTGQWFKAFAANNTLFIQEFSAAFQTMTSKGYSTLVSVTP